MSRRVRSHQVRRPWLAWLALLVWGAWIHAVLGRFAMEPALGGFVPDLGLVLLLALRPRLTAREARRVALIVVLTRLAFTADAPSAVLASVVFAVALSRALAAFVDVDGFAARSLLAGVCALFSGALAASAHLARTEAGFLADAVSLAGEPVLRAAGATALAAAFLAPALRGLPGISPFAVEARRGFA